jgi:hypothetical protein
LTSCRLRGMAHKSSLETSLLGYHIRFSQGYFGVFHGDYSVMIRGG